MIKAGDIAPIPIRCCHLEGGVRDGKECEADAEWIITAPTQYPGCAYSFSYLAAQSKTGATALTRLTGGLTVKATRTPWPEGRQCCE